MTDRSNIATRFGLIAAAVLLFPLHALAQGAPNPTLIGQYGDWGVYVSKTPRVCFALSQPKERLPAGLNRDPGYIFISTRPAELMPMISWVMVLPANGTSNRFFFASSVPF